MTIAIPDLFTQFTKLYHQQPLVVLNALVRLLQTDHSLRWSIVVGAYQDEQINLGKAAELLDMHELELRDRFIELGIPLRLGPVTLAEAKAEVRAMQSWFDTETA